MTPRELTLRFTGIPSGFSKADFEIDLRSISSHDSGGLQDVLDTLSTCSIAKKHHRSSCATVTVTTSLSGTELAVTLNTALRNSGLPYHCDCEFHGITPLFEPHGGDADCDIIAVPGLASHAVGSWKAPNSNDVWLRDWLPKDVPNIRVALYGYDTSLWKNDSKSSIEDLGRGFLESLETFRRNTSTEDRPVIFMGHSLGGLLIKEALATSSKDNAIHESLYKNCHGFLFFAVPHLGLRHDTLQTIVEGQPNEELIRSIVVDNDSEPSAYLSRIRDDFARCFDGEPRIACFYERDESPKVEMRNGQVGRTETRLLLVTKQSATETGVDGVLNRDVVPLKGNHSSIVKFESNKEEGYENVVKRIKDFVSGARLANASNENRQSGSGKSRNMTVHQGGNQYHGNVTMSGGHLNQGNQSIFNEHR